MASLISADEETNDVVFGNWHVVELKLPWTHVVDGILKQYPNYHAKYFVRGVPVSWEKMIERATEVKRKDGLPANLREGYGPMKITLKLASGVPSCVETAGFLWFYMASRVAEKRINSVPTIIESENLDELREARDSVASCGMNNGRAGWVITPTTKYVYENGPSSYRWGYRLSNMAGYSTAEAFVRAHREYARPVGNMYPDIKKLEAMVEAMTKEERNFATYLTREVPAHKLPDCVLSRPLGHHGGMSAAKGQPTETLERIYQHALRCGRVDSLHITEVGWRVAQRMKGEEGILAMAGCKMAVKDLTGGRHDRPIET